MKAEPIPKGKQQARRTGGRAQDDHILDPYQLQKKLHEPTACPQCGTHFAVDLAGA